MTCGTGSSASGRPVLLIPTGTEDILPPPGPNPYTARGITEPVVLFAGNVYLRKHQAEVNLIWQDRLNRLGRSLRARGIRLVAMGSGEIDRLDPGAVTHVGQIDARDAWDWQRHAGAGVVLAHGEVQDNESSKVYYYLRTALPVVCERPVPNAKLIEQMGCGRLVDLDDMEAMAAACADLIAHPPEARGLPERMVREHSWTGAPPSTTRSWRRPWRNAQPAGAAAGRGARRDGSANGGAR